MKKLLSLTVLTSSLIFSAMAAAEVEVIVHPSNAAALDKDSISRIFLGKTRGYPGGGEAIPVSMGKGNASFDEFTQGVLGKSTKQLKAYWAKMVFTGKGTPPKEIGSAAELSGLVANNPNIIGFVPAGSAGAGVRVVGKF
jgi:hypothetical protein